LTITWVIYNIQGARIVALTSIDIKAFIDIRNIAINA